MPVLIDFKAVIFDLDGLVLETETTYVQAWQQAAEELGYFISDDFCRHVSGLPFAQLEVQLKQSMSAAFPLAEFYRLSGSIWRELVEREGIAVKKGVHELTRLLQTEQIAYCLATNSPELNTRECLHYAGISELFPLMVCRDHVNVAKPAPDIFLQAAQVLQQPIGQCLVLEDSLTGLLAATNATAFSVLVPSMSGQSEKMTALADLVVNDLSELSAIVHHKLQQSS